MPRPDDPTDGPSTLPLPELNPLLNPILGQNMGRWAEVYFTSPPEKREQAVLDLLRELQGDSPAPEVTASSPVSEQSVSGQSQPMAAPVSRPAEIPAGVVYCHACGRENPASHRFCGMCGTPVAAHGAAAELEITDLHVADLAVAGRDVADPAADFQRAELYREVAPSEDRQVAHLFAQEPAPQAQVNEQPFIPSVDAASEPASTANDFLSPRGGRQFDDRDDRARDLFEPAPVSRPYPLYIGIAVAVVLALVYVGWRSGQTSSPSSRVAEQAAPEVNTQPVTPPSVPKADTPEPVPDQTSDRTSELASPAAPHTAVPSNNPGAPRQADSLRTDSLPNAAGAASSREATPLAAGPTVTIDEQSLQAEPVSANGAEELALAQRYLNGAAGQERNSAEAAKWLWKAIAKRNADASLLLSDLYLKGDGVPKNCEQARVLLDAAAIRGMKGAGDRLRHLQAFGCP